jgi:hypothetical protein
MSSAPPIAHRVVRRFLAGKPEPEPDEDSYRITTMALADYLTPNYGPLRWVRFVPPLPGTPYQAAWQALTDRHQLMQGRIVLHVGLGEGVSIILSPEVMVDSITSQSGPSISPPPRTPTAR